MGNEKPLGPHEDEASLEIMSDSGLLREIRECISVVQLKHKIYTAHQIAETAQRLRKLLTVLENRRSISEHDKIMINSAADRAMRK